MCKIEKDIPMPYKKYPYQQLKVGESFFVAFNGDKPTTVRARIVPALTRANYTSKKKFKTRTVIEGGQEGLRVWRVR